MRKGEKLRDLIIYKNEKDSKKVMEVTIIKIGPSYVKFKTDHSNIITIPMNRVIKIKQKEVGNSE